MKKHLLLAAMLLMSITAFSQAKKPTLMVIPSDVWCEANGYYLEVDNMGMKQHVPDYQRAIQTDMELAMAITTINDLMAERGFPLKDMGQTLKMINMQLSEQELMTSKQGNMVAETTIDRLSRYAKADILLYLGWNIQELGPKKTLSFSLEGIDAYTNKSIGAAHGVSSPSFSADVPTLLHEAVVANIDVFNNRLQSHFEDMFENGREVALEIRVFDNNAAGIDLETEYNGMELGEIIDAWMVQNTVAGRFSKLYSSETQILYEQVRIPIYNNLGVAQDTESWARKLRKELSQSPLNIPVKLSTKGLGRVILYIGEK